jgi:probable rRNA maturation factor
MEISVIIEKELDGKVEKRWLKSLTEKVIKAQGIGDNVEIGIVLAGADKIRQLNRDYLGHDEPTDVISFSAREEPSGESVNFVQPPDDVLHLGEVVVSYPQAVIQAQEYGHTELREIQILVIHGVLHLMGYEHDKPEPAREMRAREAATLSRIEGKD